jgi:hypothetical protein
MVVVLSLLALTPALSRRKRELRSGKLRSGSKMPVFKLFWLLAQAIRARAAIKRVAIWGVAQEAKSRLKCSAAQLISIDRYRAAWFCRMT